ncbi:MAG: hypothetical protein Q9174_003766 [Haloplaca sp. 1 TL-2023]
MKNTEAQLKAARSFTGALKKLEVLADIQAKMLQSPFLNQADIIENNWQLVDGKLNKMLLATVNEPRMTLEEPLGSFQRLTSIFAKLKRTGDNDPTMRPLLLFLQNALLRPLGISSVEEPTVPDVRLYPFEIALQSFNHSRFRWTRGVANTKTLSLRVDKSDFELSGMSSGGPHIPLRYSLLAITRSCLVVTTQDDPRGVAFFHDNEAPGFSREPFDLEFTDSEGAKRFVDHVVAGGVTLVQQPRACVNEDNSIASPNRSQVLAKMAARQGDIADVEERINEVFEEIGELANILPGLRGKRQGDRVNGLISHRFNDLVELSKTASSPASTRRLIQRIIDLRSASPFTGSIIQSKTSDTIDDLVSQLEGQMAVKTKVPLNLTVPLKNCVTHDADFEDHPGGPLTLSISKGEEYNLSIRDGKGEMHPIASKHPFNDPFLAVWSKNHPYFVRLAPVRLRRSEREDSEDGEDGSVELHLFDEEGAKKLIQVLVAMEFTYFTVPDCCKGAFRHVIWLHVTQMVNDTAQEEDAIYDSDPRILA